MTFGLACPGSSPGGGAQGSSPGLPGRGPLMCPRRERSVTHRYPAGVHLTPKPKGTPVSANRPAAVVVLAAGEGTRMKSATPKVLHDICGRSLVGHVVAAVPRAGPRAPRRRRRARPRAGDRASRRGRRRGTHRRAARAERHRSRRPYGARGADEQRCRAGRHGDRRLRRHPAAHRRDASARWPPRTPPTATPSPC